jgi:hypothetical protein
MASHSAAVPAAATRAAMLLPILHKGGRVLVVAQHQASCIEVRWQAKSASLSQTMYRIRRAVS